MGGVGPGSHCYSGSLLEESGHVISQTPLWPATHHLSRIELLERDSRCGHRSSIVVKADRCVGWGQIEAASSQDELFPRVDLHLLPGLVGALGELDVGRGVVRQPDDSAVVLGPSTHVAELELLDPEDFCTETTRSPVSRGAADAPEPEDDPAR